MGPVEGVDLPAEEGDGSPVGQVCRGRLSALRGLVIQNNAKGLVSPSISSPEQRTRAVGQTAESRGMVSTVMSHPRTSA